MFHRTGNFVRNKSYITKALFICLLAALPFISIAAQQLTISEERLKLVDQYLKDQKDLPGMFIIASKGDVMFSQGFGYADRSRQFPYADQSLYTIGTITKSFTATAILLLMEQGKLELSDPITLYFKNIPESKQAITIHHLLTHTSGLPGAMGDDYAPISRSEFQKLAWSKPLSFILGENYEYSNVGYTLLGMIVESVNGANYSDLLQKYIFSKAGMLTAGYSNHATDYKNLVHGFNSEGLDWGTSKDKT